MSSQKSCGFIGLLTLASLLWFAAGMPPWWAPTDDQPLRATLLVFFHAGGLLTGWASLFADIWPEERKQ